MVDEAASLVQSFNYLMVMPGVVSGLALGKLLKGAAFLLQHQVWPYGIHLLWIAIISVMQILYWHTTAICAAKGIAGNMPEYALFFIFPAMVYLAATVLVPTPSQVRRGRYSLRKYYYDHAEMFFTICYAGLILEVVFGKWLSCTPDVLAYENRFRIAGACVAFVLATAKIDNKRTRERLHWSMTVGAILVLLGFVCVVRWPDGACVSCAFAES